MSGQTAKHKLPYPTDGDPIYKGAEQMQALAEAVDAKLGTGSGSGGASGSVKPDPNTLVQRDAGGRTQVAAPAGDLDATNRAWITAQKFASETYVADAIRNAGLDNGNGDHPAPAAPSSVTATANTLALRDAAGRTQVATPAADADAATKGYVDTRVSGAGFITDAALTPYATKTYVDTAVGKVTVPTDIVKQSDLNALRTELYGGPTRTFAPYAEIVRARDASIVGGYDLVVENDWNALVDTDNGFVKSSLAGQTRYRVPVAGRYEINYSLVHEADGARAGCALKIFVGGSNVQQHTIATQPVAMSLEGPNGNLTTDVKLKAGDLIRWGWWYSDTTTQRAIAFGQARSRISIRYVGSR
jgi:hypothetical protein